MPETGCSHQLRSKISLHTFLPSFAIFKAHPNLPRLVSIYAVLVLATQMPLSLWILYGESRFGWTARSVGSFLALYGLLAAGVQFVLMTPLIRWTSERSCLAFSALVNATAFTLLSIVSEGWIAFILLPLWGLGAAGFPTLQSMLSKTMPAEHQGQLQGSLVSLSSLIGIPTPILATTVFTYSPSRLPGFVWLLTAFMYIVVLILSVRRVRLWTI